MDCHDEWIVLRVVKSVNGWLVVPFRPRNHETLFIRAFFLVASAIVEPLRREIEPRIASSASRLFHIEVVLNDRFLETAVLAADFERHPPGESVELEHFSCSQFLSVIIRACFESIRIQVRDDYVRNEETQCVSEMLSRHCLEHSRRIPNDRSRITRKQESSKAMQPSRRCLPAAGKLRARHRSIQLNVHFARFPAVSGRG